MAVRGHVKKVRKFLPKKVAFELNLKGEEDLEKWGGYS